jgi:serine phosphatase RsbU (regulator of sigma subunit)/pSer/pThr/pTyr-binding forkhead associated (FHA) protein
MASLELLTGANAGRRYEITRDTTIIGRDRYPICDVVIREPTVSRQHSRIVRDGDSYHIEDLGSLNGTYVNREKITGRTPLNDGDVVQIYEVLMQFNAEVADSTSTGGEAPAAAIPFEEADGNQVPTKVVSTLDATAGTPVETSFQAKFQTILEINRNLGTTLVVDEMLSKLLDGLFKMFPQTDRGYILLADEPDGRLTPKAFKDRKKGGGSFSSTMGPINRKVARRAFSKGHAVLSMDQPTDDDSATISVLEVQNRSAMCAPLIGPSRKPLGVIYIDTNDPQLRFSREDLELLSNVAGISAQALEFAQIHQAQLEETRRGQELQTARTVQMHFLPQSRPKIPGYRFYHHYHAAREIGGDYFGYIPLPDGRLAVAIGDVAGKGVSAALMMARLCSEVRYCLLMSVTPADAVHRMNRQISSLPTTDRFVTFLLGVLDPQTHELTFVNAGHIPPLRRRGADGVVERLEGGNEGPPLGIDANADYNQFTIRLEPGDTVVMYTDGVNEAMDPNDAVYGHSRARSVLGTGPRDVVELGQTLLTDVQRFVRSRSQNDDICLLCLGRVARPENAADE